MADAIRRIAIVIPNLGLGGLERLMIVLAREWVALGWQVDFVLMRREGPLLEALPASSCNVIELGVDKLRQVAAPLSRYLRETRPTATILAMWPLTVIGTWAWLRAGRPGHLVVSEHTNLKQLPEYASFWKRYLLRLSIAVFYRLADRCIAVSHGVADSMASAGYLRRNTIDVIHNAAAYRFADGFRLPPDGESPFADVASKRILAVGTLKEEKDYPTLLHAFQRVSSCMRARLTIVGDGPLRVEIEQLIRTLNLGDHVDLVGSVMEPAPWFRCADLFVLSSRYEGFGNVIVEALQWGVPVVSTDCPSGPAEILDDGRYGRLVPVGDVVALANAMIAVLGEKTDRDALEARARVFSPRPVALRYLTVMFPQEAAMAPDNV